MTPDSIINRIFETYRLYGDALYPGGEVVTQIQHALQTAYFIQQDGAPDTLIAAALLHDFGHVLHDIPKGLVSRNIDGKHEEIGAVYLSEYFTPAVTEPGRLHVAAKCYMCATDPDYFGKLSSVSVRSLELQGGPFSEQEVQAFESNPYFKDAVHLRRCDEKGKDPDLQTPDLESYRPFLEAGLK